jgi:hypothetical protein
MTWAGAAKVGPDPLNAHVAGVLDETARVRDGIEGDVEGAPGGSRARSGMRRLLSGKRLTSLSGIR